MLIAEGVYLLMNSSSGKNKGLSLLKKSIKKGDYCLDFWYMMYGQDVKQLRVYTEGKSDEKEIEFWKEKGNKGEKWLNQKITINVPAASTVSNN